MDLARIKNFIKQNGDKFVVMEDGEPEVVIMSFREYEGLMQKNSAPSRILKDKEQLLKDTNWGEEKLEETEFFIPPRVAEEHKKFPFRAENIRLEDLPL